MIATPSRSVGKWSSDNCSEHGEKGKQIKTLKKDNTYCVDQVKNSTTTL